MTKETALSENSSAFFYEKHKDVLEQVDQLNDVLTNLRYEGKVHVGRNMNDIEKVLIFFSKELLPHVKLDEMVFAFVEKHIPKLESVVRLLQAEHKEMVVNIEVFSFLFRELEHEKNESKRVEAIEKLRDKGTYLVYLLRNHIQAESEIVYKIIDRELRPEEKKTLFKLVKELKAE